MPFYPTRKSDPIMTNMAPKELKAHQEDIMIFTIMMWVAALKLRCHRRIYLRCSLVVDSQMVRFIAEVEHISNFVGSMKSLAKMRLVFSSIYPDS